MLDKTLRRIIVIIIIIIIITIGMVNQIYNHPCYARPNLVPQIC